MVDATVEVAAQRKNQPSRKQEGCPRPSQGQQVLKLGEEGSYFCPAK